MRSNPFCPTEHAILPKLAVVAAVEEEISLVVQKMTSSLEMDSWLNGRIIKGAISNTPLVVGWSSIGAVNMAHLVTRLCLINPSVERLLLIGCGGGYEQNNVGILDFAVATKELYGDLGVVRDGGLAPLDVTGIPLMNTVEGPLFNEIPIGESWQSFPDFWQVWSREHSETALHQGPFVTVNGVSGSRARAETLVSKWGPVCESMEGAAAAQISLFFGLDFMEIRCISNLVGHYQKDKWQLSEAKRKIQEFILNYLHFIETKCKGLEHNQ